MMSANQYYRKLKMKLMTTILALVCSSALLCSEAWAQGNTSRTYFGTNGPQGGQQPGSSRHQAPTPDNFRVNVYGQGNAFTFEALSQGGEICGRPYYFRGHVTFQANQPTGSISGPMLRCTNQELKDACAKVGVTLTDYYEVTYTGTVDRSRPGIYIITITYPYATWVREDCKEARTTEGTEMLWLTYEPPTPAEPTTRELIDRAKKKAVDTWYDSMRGGRWLQNRPR